MLQYMIMQNLLDNYNLLLQSAGAHCSVCFSTRLLLAQFATSSWKQNLSLSRVHEAKQGDQFDHGR